MTDAGHGAQGAVAKVGLLAEPVRRALYEYVVSQPHAVDRDQAAAGVGIGRPLAAFHLDRLARAGLLDVEYRRRTGRTGPGAGRTAKFYRRARAPEVEVTLPPRRYRIAAEILADGVERHGDAATVTAVEEAARDRGRREAQLVPADRDDRLRAFLEQRGYEPTDDASGEIRLRNCPFDALVERHRPLTCGMNLAMLHGVVEGLGDRDFVPTARPEPGLCCVAFVPASHVAP